MKFLVTGAAGFIGFHTAKKLLDLGHTVTGLDNLNPYYDVRLKRSRLRLLQECKAFSFLKENISNRPRMKALFDERKFDRVIHLAAQAGVRYSLVNPHAYIESNVTGFLNILEGCRFAGMEHLVFASSSSVYGASSTPPFSIHQNVDHPISLYAATKKADELMAHAYSSLYQIPCTGLRFFTVYGPWGRPDMALFLFTRSILEGKPIDVYNRGRMKRDFTYIDDIVDGVVRIQDKPPKPRPRLRGGPLDPGSSSAPFQIFNIGNNKPVGLLTFIRVLEKTIGKKAVKNFLPLQPGDVPETCADISDIAAFAGFRPRTSIEAGIPRFVEWYREYYTEKACT